MYCRKCGKQIEGTAEICAECLSAEAPAAEIAPAVETVTPVATAPVAAPVVEQKVNKKFGILGMVFGIVSVYLMISMLSSIPMTKEMLLLKLDAASGNGIGAMIENPGAAGAVFIVGGVIALLLCIPSIIMGLFGTLSAVKGLKAGQKAIPTLVMSCVGFVLCLVSIILFVVVINNSLAFIEYFENYISW